MKIKTKNLWVTFWIFLILVALSFSANAENYFFGGVQYGNQTHGNWIGDNPVFVRFGYHHEINKNMHFRVGIEHGSNLDRGENWLFVADDREETFMNQIYISGEYRFSFNGSR